MKQVLHGLLITVFLLQAGCMQDDELWSFEPSGRIFPFEGLFVINQGNFMYGNASLSYYDPETREVFNEAFFRTNALPLGDVAQSMVIRDSLGYVVINNSGRIYVFDTRNFSLVGKITGLTSPRYLHFISDTKAYVTDLYSRSIAIVDPSSMEVTGAIDVNNPGSDFSQHATEQMVQLDQYVYTNCWSYDNMILVIDSETDRVVDSIEVVKQPNSMVLDRYRTLWVLSDGGFPESPYGYELPGLMKIEAGSRKAELVHRFPEGAMPRGLTINGSGDTLYFLNRGVYRHAVLDDREPELLIEGPSSANGNAGFYALAVDPASSELYVADALDFVQQGRVYRFTPASQAIDTFLVGIVPGAFCFKP
jgi:DNA-binding beta-propeller fold protein YncE